MMYPGSMNAVLACLFLCGLVASQSKACNSGWFGSDCQFKCHCLNNSCDEEGNCVDNSTCDSGWFGPACQYVNLAPTGKSSVPEVIQYSKSTCTGDPGVQNITVYFTTPILFTWMRLESNGLGHLQHIQPYFKNSGSDFVIICENLRKAMISQTTLDIHCDVDAAVDEVILEGKGVESICSLYISGGRNVALKQITAQSSTYQNQVSGYAVDGNTEIDEQKGATCSHTDNAKDIPHWNVTFAQPALVTKYVLYNRYSYFQRLRGFILDSFTDDGLKAFNYRDNETTPKPIYTVTPPAMTQSISHVMITATEVDYNDWIFLTLCEVEIYGESTCPKGYYGLECKKTCNCNNGENCFVTTGGCPSGCASGFHGFDCKDECPLYHHGVNCKENCSTGCIDQLCNAATGVCLQCQAGKKGDYCQLDCTSEMFGPRCLSPCPPNCKVFTDSSGQRLCDSVNGSCFQDCKAGYLGHVCNETCPNGKYGGDCLKDCSQYCNRESNERTSVCHHITGLCLHGCIKGYSGHNCTTFEEDDAKTALQIVTGLFSGLFLIVIIVIIVIVIIWLRRRNTARKNVAGPHSAGFSVEDNDQAEERPYGTMENIPNEHNSLTDFGRINQPSPDLPVNIAIDESGDLYEYIGNHSQRNTTARNEKVDGYITPVDFGSLKGSACDPPGTARKDIDESANSDEYEYIRDDSKMQTVAEIPQGGEYITPFNYNSRKGHPSNLPTTNLTTIDEEGNGNVYECHENDQRRTNLDDDANWSVSSVTSQERSSFPYANQAPTPEAKEALKYEQCNSFREEEQADTYEN